MRVRKRADVGWVYTSVFRDSDGSPVEVFINIGKPGGYLSASAEVTGRLVSRALKYGATLEEVASDLVGISCGTPVGFGPTSVLSAFDAVGKSIIEIARAKQLPLPIAPDEDKKLEAIITPQTELETLTNGHTQTNGHSHTNGHTNGNPGGNSIVKTTSPSTNFQMSLPSQTPESQNLLSAFHQEQTVETKFNSCPDCGSPLVYAEGCRKCINETCGWSKCS